jgi:hypothetical protein
MEYSKQVYRFTRMAQNEMKCDYESELITRICDIHIWDKVFGKLDPLLQYYVHLLTNYKGVLDMSQRMPPYCSRRSANAYESVTFQDYIDESINVRTIGAADYQQFIKNMALPEFNEKMTQKYTENSIHKVVKNHFIYVVNLHVLKSVRRLRLVNMSYQEEEDMDMRMDAIPYFNLLNERGYSIEDIEDGNISDPVNTTVDELTFHLLELRAMKMINNSF